MIDGTFTEDEWTFLSTQFEIPSPRLCPPQFDLDECAFAATLGKDLFFDPSLSGPILIDDPLAPGEVGEAGKVSCASCHDPKNFFIDTRSQPSNVSIGAGAKRTKHNAMSTLNLAYKAGAAEANCARDNPDSTCSLVFSWTGKYPTPGEVLQIAGANAMNAKGETLSNALRADKYKARYRFLFGANPPSCDLVNMVCTCPMGDEPCHRPTPAPADAPEPDVFTNVSLLFDAYVRQPSSFNAPFDCYIKSPIDGQRTTATCEGFGDKERRGLSIFIGKGMCVDCHRGGLLSDLDFHNTGVAQVGPNVQPIDGGYGDEPGVSDARDGEFLTPPLRHVARTAPYMHSGQLATLGDVIAFYRRGGDAQGFSGTKDGRMQPLEITDDEARDLEAFLRSLTGDADFAPWVP